MDIERKKSDWKPRASDLQLQAMFMAMDEGAVLISKSGEVFAVNPAAETILGFAAADLIGRSAAECVRQLNFVSRDETSISPELRSAMLAVQTGKAQRNVVVGAHQPDGTLVWISINAQPLIQDGDSAPYAVVTTFRDVTERKRTEDALYFVAQRGWKDSADSFFAALAQYLGESLGVDYAVIKRLDEDSGHVETIALYAKGTIVPNRRFPLKGTSYNKVLEQKFLFHPQGIQQLFPEDTLLAEMGTESYAGLALWDSAGQPIGVVSVMCSRPFREEALVSKTLQIVAPRVAAELERERNERSLRQSERKFRTLAENMPDNLIRFDLQARAQYMNSAMMADVAPEVLPVLGETLAETFPGNDVAALHQRAIERAIATGIPAEFEFQVPNPQGEMRVHHICYVAEHDSSGEIVGALGIGRDVTERKRIEKYEQFRTHALELLSGGASLQDVLENIALGVEQLNPGMICSILVLDSRGKCFSKGIGPSLPDFYNEALDGAEIGIGVGSCGTAAATGERVIVDDIMTHPYWTPYKELAARAGLAACWSEPIRSSSGQILGTFAVYHREKYSPAAFDFSVIEKTAHLVSIAIERTRAEEALRASEQEFRTLAENLPDSLVRYDREGRRTYINPVLEQKFAVTAEQMIGKTLRETNPTGIAMMETYQRALEHTLSTGERSEIEMQVGTPGESLRTGLCFIVAERAADGQISGAIAVTRDITERKRNEAELIQHRYHLEKLVAERTLALSAAKETAEAATRAKSHFLAAASHDLRQPLQAIGLFNEALAMTGLDEKQKRLSRNLSKSVNSLSNLLNELLDLSKLDSGMIDPKPMVIRAEDLFGMIEAEFDAAFRRKNLSLRLHYPKDGLAFFSDDNLLLTLVRNLVSNAVKYTVRGGVLVGVRRRGDRALIQVWDTGIGISPDKVEAIFEEYFQVDNPERDRAKGVGLGLAIVKRLSKLLGIEVRMRSRLGKGSVFELDVPLAGKPDIPAPALPDSAPKTVASTRLAGKRIVVIEDDAVVADAIKFSLEIAGASVTLFGSAEDALGSAQALAADHYISDFRLPGMDGLQLLDTIQAKSAAPIKAVLLTGNTSPDQIAMTQTSRWKVLFKPVNLGNLLSAIER